MERQKLKLVTLNTTYPCCGGPARFRAVEAVPVERYSRRCPNCSQGWEVRREHLPLSKAPAGMRMDYMEWDLAEAVAKRGVF